MTYNLVIIIRHHSAIVKVICFSIADHCYCALGRGAVGFEEQVIDAAGYGVASGVAPIPRHVVVFVRPARA